MDEERGSTDIRTQIYRQTKRESSMRRVVKCKAGLEKEMARDEVSKGCGKRIKEKMMMRGQMI